MKSEARDLNMFEKVVYGATAEGSISDDVASLTKQGVEDTQQGVSVFSDVLGQIIRYAIRIGIALLIFFIISKILNKILKILDKRLKKTNVEPTARHFIITFIRYAVLIFTVITIIVQLNIVEASSIAALIASAGVGISLAMQGALSNFAGGLLILVLKPFREGDYIVLKNSDVEGNVQKIDMYYTIIKSIKGESISVPNSELTNHAIINSCSGNWKTAYLNVGISYDADLDRALSVLQKIKEEEPRFRKDTGRVYVDDIGESSITIGIRAQVDVEDYLDTVWDVRKKIRTAFIEEKIENPYNQLDVHIKDIPQGQS